MTGQAHRGRSALFAWSCILVLLPMSALPTVATAQETGNSNNVAAAVYAKPMQQIDLQLAVSDGPPDVAAAVFAEFGTDVQPTGYSRSWPRTEYQWKATGLWHKPLYFEDAKLERHGKSLGLVQPAVSSALFLGQVASLPYHVVDQPPHSCVYTLGYDRPGSCTCSSASTAPHTFNVGASLVEAGTIVGLVFLLP